MSVYTLIQYQYIWIKLKPPAKRLLWGSKIRTFDIFSGVNFTNILIPWPGLKC